MDEQRTHLCVGGGCAENAEILVHWSYSGETDAMCMLHAGIALQLADDAMALMAGTSTQNDDENGTEEWLVRPLTQQVSVVTGATDGLGRYVAGELAAAGATVVAHGRDPAKLERVRAELAAAAPDARIETALADLADLGQVDRPADELENRLHRLDVLVNNAGIGFGGPGAGRETSPDGYELRFAVNTWPVTTSPGGWYRCSSCARRRGS